MITLKRRPLCGDVQLPRGNTAEVATGTGKRGTLRQGTLEKSIHRPGVTMQTEGGNEK